MSIHDEIEILKLLARREKQLKRMIKSARVLVRKCNQMRDLICESDGVYGLHLNGDAAPWGDLLPSGRFEEWLSEWDEWRELPPGPEV